VSDIKVFSVNSVYDRIECEEHIALELYDAFTFDVPNAEHMRKRSPRLKNWDGKLHLFQKGRSRLYAGLRHHLEHFAKDNGYSVEFANPIIQNEFSVVEAEDFIKSLKLPFPVRDYQLDTFIKAAREKRGVYISPTASGKSLIIYLLVRYFMGMKTLIIVPRIGLVEQLIGHFKEYGLDPREVHPIYEGQSKKTDKTIVVSTWQSIYQEPPEYFNQFELVMVDEVHGAKSQSIKNVLEACRGVEYRYGFTGTLDDVEMNQWVIEGLLGPIHKVVTTKELMDRGDVAQLKIKVLSLRYPDPICKGLGYHPDYPAELEYILSQECRKRYINNLTLSLKGNTIILFRLVDKHGKILYEDLKKLLPPDRPLHLIYGGTGLNERELIRAKLANQSNAVLLGSYGCVSEGFDAPTLKHIIFGSPYKSKIKVLQSIGRGLRKYKGQTCTLYDIADDMTYKDRPNTIIKHSMERIKLYNEEQYDYKLYQIGLNEKKEAV
jgi:superfamily II DNA or RNA helicase